MASHHDEDTMPEETQGYKLSQPKQSMAEYQQMGESKLPNLPTALPPAHHTMASHGRDCTNQTSKCFDVTVRQCDSRASGPVFTHSQENVAWDGSKTLRLDLAGV